jgi:hypothetical protein
MFLTEADNSLGKIYFFTNIRHLKGDKITHRWFYKGKVKAEIDFGHSKAMTVFYKIVKLVKNGVLMIVHIYAKVSLIKTLCYSTQLITCL